MRASDTDDGRSLIDDLAAEWAVERAGGFSPGREEAFIEWCNRDPRHAVAISQVEQAMALLDEMPFVREKIEEQCGQVSADPMRSRKQGWKLVLGGMGLAASLALGALFWQSSQTASAAERHAAPAAGPQRVALSDGSVLDLNASSVVEVDFSRGERRIALTSGEGFFQVAHDKKRPFIVTANGVAVRAVGTAFSVRLVGDKVEVLVTEGRVQVDQVGPSREQIKPLIPELAVGERTQITPQVDSAPRIETVTAESVHTLLSWQDRMTSFTDVPLREMVDRMNRCNTTKLLLDDPTLGERKIGGAINLRQVNEFVRMLEQDGDIIAEPRINGEIVLRRAR